MAPKRKIAISISKISPRVTRKSDPPAGIQPNSITSNVVEIENKITDSDKNLKTYSRMSKRKSRKTFTEVPDVDKLENKAAYNDQTSSEISERASKRKFIRISSAAKSSADLPAGIKLTNITSNVVEIENKITDSDKNLKTYSRKSKRKSGKTFRLEDPSGKTKLYNDGASSEISKTKLTEETSITESADLSAKTAPCEGISNALLLKNKTTDSDKNPTISEGFISGCHVTEGFDFDKNSEENYIPPFFPSKHINQSSGSVTDYVAAFKSITDQVKNMKIKPPVHTYFVEPEGRGITAVDSSQDLSHTAYTFHNSGKIYLFSTTSLPTIMAKYDLSTAWKFYKFAKTYRNSKGEKWDVFSNLPQQFIIGHGDEVTGLRFTSNGTILMSCSLDGHAKAISTTTYRVLEDYIGTGSLLDIDVSLDFESNQFVTANALSSSPFHTSSLYTFERKDPVQNFNGHSDLIKCIRFHPNKLYFATSAMDKSIKLWSVRESKELRCFKDEEMDNPNKLAFSPDWKYLASAHGGCVNIWDIASGRKLKCLNSSNPDASIFNICYDLEGKMLAAGGSDKQIHFWNILSDEKSEKPPEYDFLESQQIDKTIYSIKYVSSFFSCVTG